MYDKFLIFYNKLLYNKVALLQTIMIYWWEEIIRYILMAQISIALIIFVYAHRTETYLANHARCFIYWTNVIIPS